MKFSTPILAKELKKELIANSVKVFMCKQYAQNAVLAIGSDAESIANFVNFCEVNNYAGVCGLAFNPKPSNDSYINLGHIFKYIDA